MAHPLRAVDERFARRVAAVPKERFFEAGWALLQPRLAQIGFIHKPESAFCIPYKVCSDKARPDAERIRLMWEEVEQFERDRAADRAVVAGWAQTPEGLPVFPGDLRVKHKETEVLRAFASLFTAQHEDRLLDVVWHLRNYGATIEEISAKLPA